MSQMEKTLRLPCLIRTAIKLFLSKTAPIWLIFVLIFWFLLKSLFASVILGFVASIIWEMFFLRNWYERKVFPTHLRKLSEVKKAFEKLDSYSTPELITQIEETAQKSAWNLVHSGYLILPSWGWEIVFKGLYPFLVSDQPVPYQNLLIGFSNKTIEADQRLWEVSQEKDPETQKKLLDEYLEIFGSRVEDLDLAYPTLRERPKAIESLLALSKLTPSPNVLLETARNRREQSLKQVYPHLRIPVSVFNWLLQIVQKNVALREDRRYHEFQADYYLRRMLIHLSEQIDIPENKIFNLSWKEAKNATHG